MLASIAILIAAAALAIAIRQRSGNRPGQETTGTARTITDSERAALEPSDSAARISHVVDLYLQVTASGVNSQPAALLRAGAALLYSDAEVREAARQISQYTGKNPLDFLSGFRNVSPKDVFRIALAESLDLVEPAQVNDVCTRLLRGLLEARITESAQTEEHRVTKVLSDFDQRLATTVAAMKPIVAILEQLRSSLNPDDEVSFFFPPAGHMASVKVRGGTSSDELSFTFDPDKRKYRVTTTTRYFFGDSGSYDKAEFAETAEDAVEYAARAIGTYRGSKAAHTNRAASKEQKVQPPGPSA